MDLKMQKRYSRKVASIKKQQEYLQDQLTLIYDKFRDAGITETGIEDVINIKLMTNQFATSWDYQGMLEEFGEGILKYQIKKPKEDYYRTSKGKNFYKQD